MGSVAARMYATVCLWPLRQGVVEIGATYDVSVLQQKIIVLSMCVVIFSLEVRYVLYL